MAIKKQGGFMEVRGVRLKKKFRYDTKNSGFFVLRDPDYFSVPLLADDGVPSKRVVNVGDVVKEGSLLATPAGRYGHYVYSPSSGKVVGIAKKLNASGNECEHVVISRDLQEEKEGFAPIYASNFEQEILLKRLYESGMVDNVPPYDPAYKKYLLKCNVDSLIINCTEDDPYKTSDSALIETYLSEIVEGAKLLKIVAKANKIVFIFTSKQKAIIKLVKNHIKNLQAQKEIKVKIYPNVYPLHDSRLIGYYETGTMVPEGNRTAETRVIVDSPSNCYDMFNAVRNGIPCTRKAVTISGDNCLRKANYFVKNGTPIDHILNIVGMKNTEEDNKLVYGGIMSGIAQETLDISVTLTASSILFCNRNEYITDKETECINCGKCVACCPVKLHVKNIDQAVAERDFNTAKKLGAQACIGCGACSYICPAKRYLAQRVSYAKDVVLGRTAKRPESSEFEMVEGEDRKLQKKDSILQITENFTLPQDKGEEVPEIEEMLNILKKETENSNVGGENNGK